MGHIDYRAAFDSLRNQRNVMALVGNGFDIQVMHDYKSRTNTTYENFGGVNSSKQHRLRGGLRIFLLGCRSQGMLGGGR